MLRKDDLQYNGLILYQDDALPCFTEDAVLLVHFLRLTARDTVIDLGTGTGLIAILGSGRTGARFTAVDTDESVLALARRSAAGNGQTIDFLHMDVTDAPSRCGHGTFTAVVTNPPYFTAGDPSPDARRSAARHGDALEPFLTAAFLLLKNGGRLFLIYPADAMADLVVSLRAHRLEPKRMKPCLPDAHGAPRRILVEAKKLGKPGLTLLPMETR